VRKQRCVTKGGRGGSSLKRKGACFAAPDVVPSIDKGEATDGGGWARPTLGEDEKKKKKKKQRFKLMRESGEDQDRDRSVSQTSAKSLPRRHATLLSTPKGCLQSGTPTQTGGGPVSSMQHLKKEEIEGGKIVESGNYEQGGGNAKPGSRKIPGSSSEALSEQPSRS